MKKHKKIENADIESDYLIKINLKNLKIEKSEKRKNQNERKKKTINWKKRKSKKKYQERIETICKQRQEIRYVEEIWTQFKEIRLKTAKKTCVIRKYLLKIWNGEIHNMNKW